jgi:hypothetical protein
MKTGATRIIVVCPWQRSPAFKNYAKRRNLWQREITCERRAPASSSNRL